MGKKAKQNLEHAKQHVTNVDTSKNQIFSKLLYPGSDKVLKGLLLIRICSAFVANISDCDETYNYWEPTHYLVFGKGFQTWEYSPQYALRSYAYILLHALPGYICKIFMPNNPLLVFYIIRCILSICCALVEHYFYKSVCREFGVHVGRLCIAFQIFSAGMFISAAAYLPSSFAMYTFTAAAATWWLQKYNWAIFFVALGALLGWPFAALLGLPIAIDLVLRKRLFFQFMKSSLISAILILMPMILIDSYYYGRVVLAPWNIVKYNIFSGAGPNLYGTEPLSYYIINCFLNFNFIWVFALSSPLFLILQYLYIPAKHGTTLSLPIYISLAPLFIWILVFFAQPHKEERFLFPVYPMICLSGAIGVDIMQKLIHRIVSQFKKSVYKKHYLETTTFVTFTILLCTCVLGISRICSLYHNYHAPIDIFSELYRTSMNGHLNNDSKVHVCLGKEWFRYPSSFFMPNNNWNVHFIKSEFKGMLPAPYSEYANGTSIIHNYFNDKNQEEPSLYFAIEKCHLLIDVNLGRETTLEPTYSNNVQEWKMLMSLNFLNAEKSNRFFRAFFVPFFNSNFVYYGRYVILQSNIL